MIITVDEEEAIRTIDALLKSVREGNEIIIEQEGSVLARISPETPKQKRVPGLGAGRITIHPSFYDPMTDEELKDWGML